jgi:hypothetical protein
VSQTNSVISTRLNRGIVKVSRGNTHMNLDSLREHVVRLYQNVIKSVNEESIIKAIKKQQELAEQGDLNALKFLLSLFGSVGFSGRSYDPKSEFSD